MLFQDILFDLLFGNLALCIQPTDEWTSYSCRVIHGPGEYNAIERQLRAILVKSSTDDDVAVKGE